MIIINKNQSITNALDAIKPTTNNTFADILQREMCGGKKTCKYYKACGNTENCSRCTAYTKGNR